MKPAEHPATCTHCRGAGYTDGPPIHGIVYGRPHQWPTVQPCRHEWWNENPDAH